MRCRNTSRPACVDCAGSAAFVVGGADIAVGNEASSLSRASEDIGGRFEANYGVADVYHFCVRRLQPVQDV